MIHLVPSECHATYFSKITRFEAALNASRNGNAPELPMHILLKIRNVTENSFRISTVMLSVFTLHRATRYTTIHGSVTSVKDLTVTGGFTVLCGAMVKVGLSKSAQYIKCRLRV